MPRVVVLCECNPKKLEWGLRYTSTLRERQRETITCKWSLRMLGLRSVAITDNLQLLCLLLSFLSPLDTKKNGFFPLTSLSLGSSPCPIFLSLQEGAIAGLLHLQGRTCSVLPGTGPLGHAVWHHLDSPLILSFFGYDKRLFWGVLKAWPIWFLGSWSPCLPWMPRLSGSRAQTQR